MFDTDGDVYATARVTAKNRSAGRLSGAHLIRAQRLRTSTSEVKQANLPVYPETHGNTQQNRQFSRRHEDVRFLAQNGQFTRRHVVVRFLEPTR